MHIRKRSCDNDIIVSAVQIRKEFSDGNITAYPVKLRPSGIVIGEYLLSQTDLGSLFPRLVRSSYISVEHLVKRGIHHQHGCVISYGGSVQPYGRISYAALCGIYYVGSYAGQNIFISLGIVGSSDGLAVQIHLCSDLAFLTVIGIVHNNVIHLPVTQILKFLQGNADLTVLYHAESVIAGYAGNDDL